MKNEKLTEEILRQEFRNNSDCYADTWTLKEDGSMIEGGVVQAMTENGFINLLKEMKILCDTKEVID